MELWCYFFCNLHNLPVPFALSSPLLCPYSQENIFGMPLYNGAGNSFAHLPEARDMNKLPNKKMELTPIPLRVIGEAPL
jgi:hypothetical protein